MGIVIPVPTPFNMWVFKIPVPITRGYPWGRIFLTSLATQLHLFCNNFWQTTYKTSPWMSMPGTAFFHVALASSTNSLLSKLIQACTIVDSLDSFEEPSFLQHALTCLSFKRSQAHPTVNFSQVSEQPLALMQNSTSDTKYQLLWRCTCPSCLPSFSTFVASTSANTQLHKHQP